MLISLAVLLFFCWLFSKAAARIHLPGLTGMILAGILLGPYALNLLDQQLLSVSSVIRKMALVFILIKAGLSLRLKDLRTNGRAAVLLSFVPALCEIGAWGLLGHLFLPLSWLEALLLGAVIASVSPAVIVPRMTAMMDSGLGSTKGIPQMILAGASMDDVIVIVLFTSLLSLNQHGSVSVLALLDIPVSILSGLAAGILCGFLYQNLVSRRKLPVSDQVLLLCCLCFFLSGLEDVLKPVLAFSGLLAVMSCAMCCAAGAGRESAPALQKSFGTLWKPAELLLFGLVGAEVSLPSAFQSGWMPVLLIVVCVLIRALAVWLCLLKTRLNWKERLFTAFAYCPKATVQAAIGAIPLTTGLSCGPVILTTAVLSILITAPAGAFWIDHAAGRLLAPEDTD